MKPFLGFQRVPALVFFSFFMILSMAELNTVQRKTTILPKISSDFRAFSAQEIKEEIAAPYSDYLITLDQMPGYKKQAQVDRHSTEGKRASEELS